MTYALMRPPPNRQPLRVSETYSSTGPDLTTVFESQRRSAAHYYATIVLTHQQELLEARFAGLVSEWREAVRLKSSLAEIVGHPAYQQIIELGLPVVPLILRELERNPTYWFAALRAITQEDPVPPDDRGRLDAMAGAWLRWGREQGLNWQTIL